jgi:NADH-quinone oxidoreductase subunit J
VGAIVILFLFGLMLTKAPIGRDSLDSTHRLVGAIVALLMLAGLVSLVVAAFPLADPVVQPAPGSSTQIGTAMFNDYVLPFEAVSFVLLAALIGAIVLARKDERDPR